MSGCDKNHIIHLFATTALHVLPDIWDDGQDRLIIICKSFQITQKVPAIFGVSAMFEFTTWPIPSFTDFFIKLRHYTAIGKQFLISNDKNWVRLAVIGLSQDGACTNLFENFRDNSLKLDLSNDITVSPPLFSLVNTFKGIWWNMGEGKDLDWIWIGFGFPSIGIIVRCSHPSLQSIRGFSLASQSLVLYSV